MQNTGNTLGGHRADAFSVSSGTTPSPADSNTTVKHDAPPEGNLPSACRHLLAVALVAGGPRNTAREQLYTVAAAAAAIRLPITGFVIAGCLERTASLLSTHQHKPSRVPPREGTCSGALVESLIGVLSSEHIKVVAEGVWFHRHAPMLRWTRKRVDLSEVSIGDQHYTSLAPGTTGKRCNCACLCQPQGGQVVIWA